MRILTFKYGEIKKLGGINVNVLRINAELCKLGHECTVITTSRRYNSFKKERYNGFNIITLVENSIIYDLDWNLISYVKDNIKRLNPDIIHIHGYHGLIFLELIFIIRKFMNLKTPIVLSPHYGKGSSVTFGGKYLWFLFNLFNRQSIQIAGKVLCASQFEKQNMIADLHLKPEKIEVIAHGVEILCFSKKNKKSRAINLLYVGYLHKLKGIDFILEAVSELKKHYNMHIILNIIGEDYDKPYKSKLVQLAKNLSINENIIWHSSLYGKRLYDEFVKADVLLLLSKTENFGIVVAEALALGTPCIVAASAALSEFTHEPGCFGVTYPPNPKEIAELIIKICEMDVKVGPFSNKIRTWDEVAKDYEQIYNELLRCHNANN